MPLDRADNTRVQHEAEKLADAAIAADANPSKKATEKFAEELHSISKLARNASKDPSELLGAVLREAQKLEEASQPGQQLRLEKAPLTLDRVTVDHDVHYFDPDHDGSRKPYLSFDGDIYEKDSDKTNSGGI